MPASVRITRSGGAPTAAVASVPSGNLRGSGRVEGAVIGVQHPAGAARSVDDAACSVDDGTCSVDDANRVGDAHVGGSATEILMAEPFGDESLRSHLTAALRLARMLVGNRAVAEDIAAESVARLLAARRRVRIDNADAYLRRIVVNQVVGRQRRWATERRFGHRFAVAPSSVDAGDEIVGRDSLARALDQLAPRPRAVLVLRYYEDLSESAVAALLKIPIGTVKSTASRGLEDLRRLLSEERADG